LLPQATGRELDTVCHLVVNWTSTRLKLDVN